MTKKKKNAATSPSSFVIRHSSLLLGAHMSIGGGVHRAIERSRSIDCTAMQIFVKNNMQWFARPLLREEIKAFLHHAQRKELGAAFAHANYLINLAATNPQFHANSLRALSEELVRADQLELPFLVMHPGAHLGAGEEAGLEKIVARSEEHTSELQSRSDLVCRLLLEKKKKKCRRTRVCRTSTR